MARIRRVRTASPVLRRFFELAKEMGVEEPMIAAKSGLHPNTLYCWRSGKVDASIFNLESALAVIGFEVVIQPIKLPEPKDLAA
jgi:hypothetical protein